MLKRDLSINKRRTNIVYIFPPSLFVSFSPPSFSFFWGHALSVDAQLSSKHTTTHPVIHTNTHCWSLKWETITNLLHTHLHILSPQLSCSSSQTLSTICPLFCSVLCPQTHQLSPFVPPFFSLFPSLMLKSFPFLSSQCPSAPPCSCSSLCVPMFQCSTKDKEHKHLDSRAVKRATPEAEEERSRPMMEEYKGENNDKREYRKD